MMKTTAIIALILCIQLVHSQDSNESPEADGPVVIPDLENVLNDVFKDLLDTASTEPPPPPLVEVSIGHLGNNEFCIIK